MIIHSHHFMKITKGTLVAIAGLTLASCASTRSSPEQVAASNPTVTYEYRNDDELIQANQQAISFCNQYQAIPRAQSFDNDEEHHNHRVIFECVGASSFSSAPSVGPIPISPTTFALTKSCWTCRGMPRPTA